MRDGGSGELHLCCLLWARTGESVRLHAYEDAVLAMLGRHGGEVTHRALRASADGDGPDEVQFFRFPGEDALRGYLDDPDRLALRDDRDRAIARTELFPVAFAPPPA